MEGETRTRGGARPRGGRNLDGRMYLMGGGRGSSARRPGGPTIWPPCGPPASRGDGRNMLRPYGVGGYMPGFPLARE